MVRSQADIRLITDNLIKLKEKRSNIVTLKKSERGNCLQEVNDSIARMKRWLKELKNGC